MVTPERMMMMLYRLPPSLVWGRLHPFAVAEAVEEAAFVEAGVVVAAEAVEVVVAAVEYGPTLPVP